MYRDVFIFVYIFCFLWQGQSMVWRAGEMSGVGVHDEEFTKNQKPKKKKKREWLQFNKLALFIIS